MYMDDLTPVIECSVSGERLPFYLDTGASGTKPFPACYKRFHVIAKDWTKKQAHIFDAGGVVPRDGSGSRCWRSCCASNGMPLEKKSRRTAKTGNLAFMRWL